MPPVENRDPAADPATSSLTAQHVMTPAPRTCHTSSTVLEAVLIFRDEDCGAVPVLEEGKPVGMVTDRDVALALPEYADLASRPVAEIMTRGIISVLPSTPLEVVKQKFGDHGVRRILVIDSEDRLHGIIAWADIAPPLSDRGIGSVVTEVIEQK